MNSQSLPHANAQNPSQLLSSVIEHTLLGDGIDDDRVIKHVNEAKELNVCGICLPLAFVPLAKKLLTGSTIRIVTVIDFPLGAKNSDEKALEAQAAKLLGADEIDMVMDYQALIEGNYAKALNDIAAVVKQVRPLPIKVIVETSALNREQLAIACALVALAEAAFIKTSTGFHTGGAHVEDITLMRTLLPRSIRIKASGGIRDQASALAMINAGADRIGCSQSRQIIEAHH